MNIENLVLYEMIAKEQWTIDC